MRPSQKVLLSIGAVLAVVVVATAVAGRVALSRSNAVLFEGDRISGNSELRGFDEVEVAGAWWVNLSRGEDWKVELPRAADRGKRIRVHLAGGRLRLGRATFVQDGWTFGWGRENGAPTRVDIVMPGLAALELKGDSRVALSGFRGERLEIDAAGAVRLEGDDARYEELELSVAGASEIDLRGVEVTDARVELVGASDVVLTMNGGVLAGSMAGAGMLRYYGSVSEERVSTAGIARIDHRGE